MTISPFNASQPIVGPDGHPTKPFRDWMEAVRQALNSASDLATAAVPASRNVVAAGGLQVGGALSDDVGVALYKIYCVVSALPTTGNLNGDWAYALNGRKVGETAGNGTGVPAWWSGSNWYAVDSGVVVAA